MDKLFLPACHAPALYSLYEYGVSAEHKVKVCGVFWYSVVVVVCVVSSERYRHTKYIYVYEYVCKCDKRKLCKREKYAPPPPTRNVFLWL